MENKDKRPAACLVTLAVLAGLLATVVAGLIGAGAFLTVADPVIQADAVAVLSGGSPQRVKTAADLFRRGHAAWLAFTDTGVSLPGSDVTASDLLFQEALDLGIPREAILFPESTAGSTAEEAQALRGMAERRGWSALLVVTDPYHTRRARLIFRQEFAGTGIQVNLRPSSRSGYHPLTWWMTRDGWRDTLSEYVKLVYYITRHP